MIIIMIESPSLFPLGSKNANCTCLLYEVRVRTSNSNHKDSPHTGYHWRWACFFVNPVPRLRFFFHVRWTATGLTANKKEKKKKERKVRKSAGKAGFPQPQRKQGLKGGGRPQHANELSILYCSGFPCGLQDWTCNQVQRAVPCLVLLRKASFEAISHRDAGLEREEVLEFSGQLLAQIGPTSPIGGRNAADSRRACGGRLWQRWFSATTSNIGSIVVGESIFHRKDFPTRFHVELFMRSTRNHFRDHIGFRLPCTVFTMFQLSTSQKSKEKKSCTANLNVERDMNQ